MRELTFNVLKISEFRGEETAYFVMNPGEKTYLSDYQIKFVNHVVELYKVKLSKKDFMEIAIPYDYDMGVGLAVQEIDMMELIYEAEESDSGIGLHKISIIVPDGPLSEMQETANNVLRHINIPGEHIHFIKKDHLKKLYCITCDELIKLTNLSNCWGEL